MHTCGPNPCSLGDNCPARRPESSEARKIRHMILSHTCTDSQGRLYYRKSLWEGWQRLRTKDYEQLNTIIDKYRGEGNIL